MTDPIARVLALAAYGRAAGGCPPCSLMNARAVVDGTLPIEYLDGDESYTTRVVRELERAAVRCRSAGHLT